MIYQADTRLYKGFCFVLFVFLTVSMLFNLATVKLIDVAFAQTERAISVAKDSQSIAEQAIRKHNTQNNTFDCEHNDAIYIDEESAKYLANVTWGEARGCSVTEKAAVMWCVLNRVDSPKYPNSVKEVVTQKSQFDGYSEDNPITKELFQLANSVLTYWSEGNDSGRVLPKEYLYFTGDGEHNCFYTTWASNAVAWDWSLPSPYEEATTK